MNIDRIKQAMLKRAAENAQDIGYGEEDTANLRKTMQPGTAPSQLAPENAFMRAKYDYLAKLPGGRDQLNVDWYNSGFEKDRWSRPVSAEDANNWNNGVAADISIRHNLPYSSAPYKTVQRIGNSIGQLNRSKTARSGNPLPAFNVNELPQKDQEDFNALDPAIQQSLIKAAPGFAQNTQGGGGTMMG